MFHTHRIYLVISLFFLMGFSASGEDLFESIAEDQIAETQSEIPSYEAQVDQLVNGFLTSSNSSKSSSVTNTNLNGNFKTNVKNLLLNFQCEKNKAAPPEYLLACDYPAKVIERENAKCFLIDQKNLKLSVATNVVYGQGGLVNPKKFVEGQNKTPLGLFYLASPAARGKNESSPSLSARILNPVKMRQVANFKGSQTNTKIPFEALGPIFYTDETGHVLQTSLGAPIFYGEGAKAILAQTRNRKMAILNSSTSVRVPLSCAQ